MKTIAIYSGRFQPFHAGHYSVYKHLVDKFGKDNVYIATSNKVELPLSPLSFDQKKDIITKMFNIPDDKVQQVKNPYAPQEIIGQFDPDTTAVVSAISDKDADRLKHGKYFKPFDGHPQIGYKDAGYYITVPEFKMDIPGGNISGTQIRAAFGTDVLSDEQKKDLFERLYGKFDTDVYNLITTKSRESMQAASEKSPDSQAKTPIDAPKQVKRLAKNRKNPEKIRNPETGNDILVKTALGYPPDEPVRKAAERVMRREWIDKLEVYIVEALLEGGNQFGKSDPISREELPDVLKSALDKLKISAKTSPIGNISKPTLGDVDIAIDKNDIGKMLDADYDKNPKEFWTKLQSYLKDNGSQHAVQSGLNQFSIGIPFNGKNVQVDFFVGDVDWMKKFLSGAPDSSYKASYRNDLIRSMLRASIKDLGNGEFERYQIDSPNGLQKVRYRMNKSKKEILDKKHITSNADKLANYLFGVDTNWSDIDTFEKLFTKMKEPNFRFKNDIPTIIDGFKKDFLGTKHASPKELDDKPKSVDGERIKNPETDNDILVKTALKYDKNHPAYKLAVKKTQREWVDVLGDHITESLLFEGGAAGHLQHPYEDTSLSFKDMKELVNRGLNGGLDAESPVTEKLDGQNIMFTFKDGKVRFARNLSQLKQFGQDSLTTDELRAFFAGRGAIEKTFGDAANDLQSAISQLNEPEKKQLFGDGQKWTNLEIIHPDSQNVIPYNSNMLVFHNTITVDEDGKPIDVDSTEGDRLAKMIQKIGAHQQSTYNISGPRFITMATGTDEKYKQQAEKYIAELDQLRQKYDLSDNDTLGDYLLRVWGERVNSVFEFFNLPDNAEMALARRWALGDKSFGKEQLKPFGSKVIAAFKTIEDNYKMLKKKAILPVESIFLQVGANSLLRMTNFISANNPEIADKLREQVKQSIERVYQSNDSERIEKLEHELERLNAIGMDKLVPTEGIVFTFNGKPYKFTGTFAPTNQILSAIKWEKSSEASSEEPPVEKKPQPVGTISHPTKGKAAQQAAMVKAQTMSPDANGTIKNPETDNDILIKTALKYDKNHPAYKAAIQRLKRK